MQVRRIVTGHNANGRAVVATDETFEAVESPTRPGIARVEVWSTDAMPVDTSEGAAVDVRSAPGSSSATLCRHCGTVIRITSFAPGSPGFMHRTETCDYAILLSGECDLELDDGKTVQMKPGDICVQRGTMHAWVNRGSEPAVFAFVLVDANPVEMAGQTLTTHYPSR